MCKQEGIAGRCYDWNHECDLVDLLYNEWEVKGAPKCGMTSHLPDKVVTPDEFYKETQAPDPAAERSSSR
jgi:hypothetical protein